MAYFPHWEYGDDYTEWNYPTGVELAEYLKEELVGKKIAYMNDTLIELDNGRVLEIAPNVGCDCCPNGNASIVGDSVSAASESAILDVKYSEWDTHGESSSFGIFILTANKYESNLYDTVIAVLNHKVGNISIKRTSHKKLNPFQKQRVDKGLNENPTIPPPTTVPNEGAGVLALTAWGLVLPVQGIYSESKHILLFGALFDNRGDTAYEVLRSKNEDTIFLVTIDSSDTIKHDVSTLCIGQSQGRMFFTTGSQVQLASVRVLTNGEVGSIFLHFVQNLLHGNSLNHIRGVLNDDVLPAEGQCKLRGGAHGSLLSEGGNF